MKTNDLSLLRAMMGALPVFCAYSMAQDAALPDYKPLVPPPLTATPPVEQERFFVGVQGGYAFSRDADMPGLPGATFEFGMRAHTWKILHEGFIAFGFYSGSDTLTFEEAHERFGIHPSFDSRYRPTVKHRVHTLPLMVGYRFTMPLGRSPFSLYAGARCGISFFQDEFVQPPWHEHYCDDDDDWYDDCRGDYDLRLSNKSTTRFSYAFDGGFKVAIDESVSLTMGYEYYRIGSAKPWHIVQLGVTWSF